MNLTRVLPRDIAWEMAGRRPGEAAGRGGDPDADESRTDGLAPKTIDAGRKADGIAGGRISFCPARSGKQCRKL
jgi:hypothetical protein